MKISDDSDAQYCLSIFWLCTIIVCAFLCSCECVSVPKETKVNLLSIGLSYERTNANSLGGTINDATEMHQALSKLYGPSLVSSQLLTDEQASKIAVLDTLSSFPDAELNILYFSGHGWTDGSLVLYADPIFLPSTELNANCLLGVEELLDALKSLQGKSLVILDSCYSGAFVKENGNGTSLVDEANPFDAVFAAYFSSRPYQASSYALSCTTADNTGKESRLWSHKHGYFTKALLDALGWDHQGNLSPPSQITLDGLYRTIKKTQAISLDGRRGQHPMVFQGTDNLVLYQANGNW